MGGTRRTQLAGRQQHEDHVRVGQRRLQPLVDDLLPEGHLLIRVPALSVPANHALLRHPNTPVRAEAQNMSDVHRWSLFHLLVVCQDSLHSVQVHLSNAVVEATNEFRTSHAINETSGL